MAMEGVVYTGTVCKTGANWGFIKCDDPTIGDMFVIPQACAAFGRELPPLNSAVQFHVITDPKTGRPRAENVEPAAGAQATQYAAFDPTATAQQGFTQQQVAAGGGGSLSGTMHAINGNFGFIKQDSGESDMFCLPPFPPVGSRVTYDIIMDPKTNRPRADNVSAAGGGAAPIWGEPGQQGAEQAELSSALDSLLADGGVQGFDAAALMQELQGTAAAMAGLTGQQVAMAGAMGGSASGVVTAHNRSGNFGFIKQDSGEGDMFLLPPLFPVGTRVVYDVITDPKTGRPRAENVQAQDGAEALPLPAKGSGKGGYGAAKGGGKGGARSEPYGGGQAVFQSEESLQQAAGQVFTGAIAKVNEKFGFIKQDNGESDMFVFPPSCAAFGRELPPVGTRVQYNIVLDNRTGRPRAEGVGPAPAQDASFEAAFEGAFGQQADGGFAQWS